MIIMIFNETATHELTSQNVAYFKVIDIVKSRVSSWPSGQDM